MSISPLSVVEVGGSKDLHGWNITFIELAKYIPFRAQRRWKYSHIQKTFTRTTAGI